MPRHGNARGRATAGAKNIIEADGIVAQALSTQESTRLGQLETIIETGIKTFIEVGLALAEIRDSRLYRSTHSTFETYCKDKWKFTRQRAYQLIGAAEVAGTIEQCQPGVDIPEKALRLLAPIPKDKRQEVYRRAVAIAGDRPVTSSDIAAARWERSILADELGQFLREAGRHEPVKQLASRVTPEMLNLKREDLKRHEEMDARHQLALQLIDVGYKVLARTLHPDKGGSREAMSRLNAVRSDLKQHGLGGPTTKITPGGPAPEPTRAERRREWEDGVIVGIGAALSALREHPEFERLSEEILCHGRAELYASSRDRWADLELAAKYVRMGMAPTDHLPAPDTAATEAR